MLSTNLDSMNTLIVVGIVSYLIVVVIAAVVIYND